MQSIDYNKMMTLDGDPLVDLVPSNEQDQLKIHLCPGIDFPGAITFSDAEMKEIRNYRSEAEYLKKRLAWKYSVKTSQVEFNGTVLEGNALMGKFTVFKLTRP